MNYLDKYVSNYDMNAPAINFKESYQIIYKNKYYDKIYERIQRKDIFTPYIEHTNKYIKERID